MPIQFAHLSGDQRPAFAIERTASAGRAWWGNRRARRAARSFPPPGRVAHARKGRAARSGVEPGRELADRFDTRNHVSM